jgi:hypothetical protein
MNGIERFFERPEPVSVPEPEPAKRSRGRPSDAAKAAAKAAAAVAQREADEADDHELGLLAVAQEDQWEREAAEHSRRHQKRKKGHSNWALPANQAVLAPAVKGWLDGSARKEGYTMQQWCVKHSTEDIELKKGTFSQYVMKNKSKRLKLLEDGGAAVGNAPTLDQQESQLLVDVIRRSDRGNEPKSMPEVTLT